MCVSSFVGGGYIEPIKGRLSAVLRRRLNPAKGLISSLQEALREGWKQHGLKSEVSV